MCLHLYHRIYDMKCRLRQIYTLFVGGNKDGIAVLVLALGIIQGIVTDIGPQLIHDAARGRILYPNTFTRDSFAVNDIRREMIFYVQVVIFVILQVFYGMPV